MSRKLFQGVCFRGAAVGSALVLSWVAGGGSLDCCANADSDAPVVCQAPQRQAELTGDERGQPVAPAVMGVLKVVGALVDIIGSAVDIANSLTDATDEKLDSIIEGVNKISGQVSELKEQMTAYAEETRTRLEAINIKLSQLLLEGKDLKLSEIETGIEQKYGKFNDVYVKYNDKSTSDKKSAFKDGTFNNDIQSACALVNLEQEQANLVNYRKLMCGTGGATGALYALTDLLLEKMTLSDENARVSPTNAYLNLRRYFASKLIYQECELFVIKEYVLGVTGTATKEQRETAFKSYAATFASEVLKPQMEAFMECVDKIVLANADLLSSSGRGDTCILQTLKNSNGDVYFSPDVAGDIFFDADFLAACAAPTLYSFGVKCHLVAEPCKFPNDNTANLVARLSDGAGAVDMTSDGRFPRVKAAYLQ